MRGSNSRNLPYRRTASSVVIRQPSSLPDRLFVKLVYRESVSFSGSGTLEDNVYRGNSLFDPNLTGAGGQPMGFDQWSALYASYTVMGSTIEVTGQFNSGTGTGARVGVTPTNFSTVYGTTDYDRAEEQPYTRSCALTMGAAGIGQSRPLKSYMSTAKMIGVVQPAVQIEDAYGALVSANPTNTWFWHCWTYPPAGGDKSVIVNVKITYFAVFETRNQLAVS